MTEAIKAKREWRRDRNHSLSRFKSCVFNNHRLVNYYDRWLKPYNRNQTAKRNLCTGYGEWS